MNSAISIKENTSSTSQAVDGCTMNSSVKKQQAVRYMPAGSGTEVGQLDSSQFTPLDSAFDGFYGLSPTLFCTRLQIEL